MSNSTAHAAIASLRDKVNRPPRNIANDHRPPLLSFSEFIARSKNNQIPTLPESVRMANRQLSEQLINDETIDYIHSQIPFGGDDDEKRETVADISETLARFIDMGDVLIFAICVRPID